MDYDRVLEHVGEYGPWNLLNQALIWVPNFIGGLNVLVNSFTGERGKQVTT